MSQIAVIAEPALAISWARELETDGHVVERYWGPDIAASLFEGTCAEIVIVDIEHPEWPESLLIPQSHATWPECKTIAVVSSYAFRTSAVYEMGLWKPDQLLLKPLAPRVLAATVTLLWAQLRTNEIRRMINAHPFALDAPAKDVQAPDSWAEDSWGQDAWNQDTWSQDTRSRDTRGRETSGTQKASTQPWPSTQDKRHA